MDIWNYLWGTWINFFEKIIGPGGGNVFFLIPIMVLAMGLWFKNSDKPMVAVVFVIGSCALLGSGNLFYGAYGASLIFYIFTGLGLTALIMNVVFHREGV